jgi:hypothetical protein
MWVLVVVFASGNPTILPYKDGVLTLQQCEERAAEQLKNGYSFNHAMDHYACIHVDDIRRFSAELVPNAQR